jgi:hypothetical protein
MTTAASGEMGDCPGATRCIRKALMMKKIIAKKMARMKATVRTTAVMARPRARDSRGTPQHRHMPTK